MKNLLAMGKIRVQPMGQEDPLEEGNGNPLQYSCLEDPMDRGAWWATVHGVAKSRTRLRDFTFLCGSVVKTQLPLQWVWVRLLIRELGSPIGSGTVKKKKKKRKIK